MFASRGPTALLTLALALPAQGDGAAGSARDVRERAAAILADRDCQTSLPAPSSAGGEAWQPERPGGLSRRPLVRQGPGGDGGSVSLAAGASFSIAEPVLWIVVGLAAAWLVAAIVRSLQLGGAVRARKEEEPLVARPRVPVPAPVDQLPDHARLAAAGEFTAAVRTLLRAAFRHLAQCTGALPAHATGRELLQLARARGALPGDDLAALVRLVEVLHFGGRPGEPRHYDDSLRHYESWRQACAAAK